MSKPTDQKPKIPQQEFLRTLKALVLERCLGWERRLDPDSKLWQWRGPDFESGELTPWLTGWEALPNMLGDLDVTMMAMQRMIIPLHAQKQTTVAIFFNPSSELQGASWVCAFSDFKPPNDKVRAQIGSSNLVGSILLTMLHYHGIGVEAHHKTYFPKLELVGNARANQAPRGGPSIIRPGVFSGPRSRGRDDGQVPGPAGAAAGVRSEAPQVGDSADSGPGQDAPAGGDAPAG